MKATTPIYLLFCVSLVFSTISSYAQKDFNRVQGRVSRAAATTPAAITIHRAATTQPVNTVQAAPITRAKTQAELDEEKRIQNELSAVQSPCGRYISYFSYLDIKIPEGQSFKRELNPDPACLIVGKAPKKVAEEGRKQTFTARLSKPLAGEVPTVSTGNLAPFISPGLIYDVRNLYSGNVINNVVSPYGENRNPFRITTTVMNFDGPPKSVINVDNTNQNDIRQKIVELNNNYTTNLNLTTNQAFRYIANKVHSKTEMGFNIGVDAKYAMVEAGVSLEMKNTSEFTTYYFEATKELFTLSAEKPQNGWFVNDISADEKAKLGYIQSVTYGVKIIGTIRIENNTEGQKLATKLGVDAGFASVNITAGAWKDKTTCKTEISLYVVGGGSAHVGTITVENCSNKIDEILRTINYKTCMPIKYVGATLDGKIINFQDATDNITYDVVTPAAVLSAETVVTVDQFRMISIAPYDDLDDIYGEVIVQMMDKNNNVLSEQYILNIRPELPLNMESNAGFDSKAAASFTYPAGTIEGSYIKVIYRIIDKDANADYGAGDDDVFYFLNNTTTEINDNPKRYAAKIIPLGSSINSLPIKDKMNNGSDNLEVMYTVNANPIKKE